MALYLRRVEMLGPVGAMHKRFDSEGFLAKAGKAANLTLRSHLPCSESVISWKSKGYSLPQLDKAEFNLSQPLTLRDGLQATKVKGRYGKQESLGFFWTF